MTPGRCGAELDFGRVQCARLAGHPGDHAGPAYGAPGAPGILAETPDLSVKYCPGCEPERDPLVGILVEWPCRQHRVEPAGLDDGGVHAALMGFGTGCTDADGANCRAAAEIIRGRA